MEFKRGYLGLKESACVSELILSSPQRGPKKLNDESEEDWCSEWWRFLCRRPRKQGSGAKVGTNNSKGRQEIGT